MLDVLIIGAGPAGLTAGIYSYRSGLETLVIGDIIGGQLSESPLVENYPGIPSASGADIANSILDQYIGIGGKFELDKVTKVTTLNDGTFEVETEYSGNFQTKTVIVATGAEHIKIRMENDDLYKNNIHYCALCDGPLYKDKDVVVLGSGNSGAQYAVELAKYCKSITICEKANKIFCDKVLQEKIKDILSIKFIVGNTVVKCNGDNGILKSVTLEDGTELPADGIFVAVGQRPSTELVKGDAYLDPRGFIEGGSDMSTNIPGLFVAGDCRVKKIRQCVTAISDGAIAATSAANYLNQ